MPNTYSTLSGLFTAIANAIRAKTGSSASIVADNFPTEIANISTGTTPTITVNANGLVTATSGAYSATHQLSNSDDADFVPSKIKSGVTIFGKTGTYNPTPSLTSYSVTFVNNTSADISIIFIDNVGESHCQDVLSNDSDTFQIAHGMFWAELVATNSLINSIEMYDGEGSSERKFEAYKTSTKKYALWRNSSLSANETYTFTEE